MMHFIFGRMTLNDLPHLWYTIGGTVSLFAMLGGLSIFLSIKKRWKWLWTEWLTTTDPKRVGVMYIIVAAVMFFRGILDAGMIWVQQAMAIGTSNGYLDGAHFQQIFTAHGDIMVFFATM